MLLDPKLVKQLEQLKGLPSPPKVALRIIETANDPNCSLSQVADVITSDPVIAAKVMRMANSALYARPGGCGTLRQALVLLGLDATLVVALSFSLALSLRRDREVGGLNLEWYWRRSLLAATAAKSVGRALGRSDSEALFLAGLLQDIGMLALDKMDPTLYFDATSLQRQHCALAEFEQERVQTDHTQVGAWLLQRWQLPDALVNSVAKSHDPMSSDDNAFARCVAMSGPLADVWMTSDWSYSFRELVEVSAESLNLNHVQIGMILDELRDQIPETEALFEKDIIDPAEGFTAMEEARELLLNLGVQGFLKEPGGGAGAQSPAAPVTILRTQHRAELDEVLQKEFEAVVASRGCAGVIVASIEGLDSVREQQGAATADRLLREAALVMLDNSGSRVVGQLTDNEIVVWLEDANGLATSMAARRTSRAFQQAIQDLAGYISLEISFQLGISSVDPLNPKSTAAELVDCAQRALGEARFGATTKAPDIEIVASE